MQQHAHACLLRQFTGSPCKVQIAPGMEIVHVRQQAFLIVERVDFVRVEEVRFHVALCDSGVDVGALVAEGNARINRRKHMQRSFAGFS
jgi:hypothetical protein